MARGKGGGVAKAVVVVLVFLLGLGVWGHLVSEEEEKAEANEVASDEERQTASSADGEEDVQPGDEPSSGISKTLDAVKEKAASGTELAKSKVQDGVDSLKEKGWWPGQADAETEEEPQASEEPVPSRKPARRKKPKGPKITILVSVPEEGAEKEEASQKPDVAEWVNSVDRRMQEGSRPARRSLSSARCNANCQVYSAFRDGQKRADESPGKTEPRAVGSGRSCD